METAKVVLEKERKKKGKRLGEKEVDDDVLNKERS
jgi:hypothetical protein